MMQDNDKLLLIDLSARLPYGVICQVNDGAAGLNDGKLEEIDISNERVRFEADVNCYWDAYIDDVKPYLRSMSSMTEEEKEVYHRLCYEEEVDEFELGNWVTKTYYHDTIESIDWLLKRHFDIRGLIEKGLAIEVTDKNNPYKNILTNNHNPQITIGTKIRSKTNPDIILSIISDDCHGDEFECSNGSVLSLRQIEKYYDIYIEEK